MGLPRTMMTAALAALTLTAIPASAPAQDRWDRAGGPRDERDIVLAGNGVPLLLPAMRGSLLSERRVMTVR